MLFATKDHPTEDTVVLNTAFSLKLNYQDVDEGNKGKKISPRKFCTEPETWKSGKWRH